MCPKVASDGRDETRAFDQNNPLQIAEWTGDDEIQQLFGGDSTRQCHGTPVKERAINAGATLPLTPPSIQPTIRDGSPGSKKLAMKQLQRHQKSCHQRVERAEKTADEGSSQCERFRAKRREKFHLRYLKNKAKKQKAQSQKHQEEGSEEGQSETARQLE